MKPTNGYGFLREDGGKVVEMWCQEVKERAGDEKRGCPF